MSTMWTQCLRQSSGSISSTSRIRTMWISSWPQYSSFLARHCSIRFYSSQFSRLDQHTRFIPRIDSLFFSSYPRNAKSLSTYSLSHFQSSLPSNLRRFLRQFHPVRRFNSTNSSNLSRSSPSPSSPSSSSSNSKKVTSTPPPSFPPSKPGLYNRLKHGMKAYGRPAFYTYMMISTLDLSLSFLAVYMGMDVDKVVNKAKVWICKIGEMVGVGGSKKDEVEETVEEETEKENEVMEKEGEKKSKSPKSLMTTFLIAYAFHKLLVPIRIPLTLALTPTVVRWLRTWGWLKDAGAISGMVSMAGGSKEVVRQAAKGKAVGGMKKGL